ncbi:MAG: acyloxyacyl hydrolase [Burkholderiaceae bacterium]
MKIKFSKDLAKVSTLCLAITCGSAFGMDSVSTEIGTGNRTQMVRLGAQWDWNKQWFETHGVHLGGYWDATIAQWRGTQYQDISGQKQNITDLGITPVFRIQSNSKKGFYGEGGIGAHYLSELYDNNGRRLSTHFQFGDHIGAGFVFQNGFDVGVRLQHYSNGGYKEPNNGVNYAILRVAKHF